VCGKESGVEAAHTTALGPRGLSQKSADYSAIPLCVWHHRGNADSYHALGERKFAEMHGLDIPELVGSLRNQGASCAGFPEI
jgi:hypothetical protein